MTIRCKFRALGVERTWDGVEVIRLAPVSGGESAENRMFWNATPSGEARITLASSSAWVGRLASGAYLYLDLVEPDEVIPDDVVIAPLVYLSGRGESWGWSHEGGTPKIGAGDVRYEFAPVFGRWVSSNEGRRYDDEWTARAWGAAWAGLSWWFSTSNRAVLDLIDPARLYRLLVRAAPA